MTEQKQNSTDLATEDVLATEVETMQAEASVSHVEEIETVIYSLDQDNTAMVSKTENGHLWKFQYGTVEVYVQLTGETDDDLLKVWAAVLPLPAKDEAKLMRKLLEMNWSETYETAFGIFNEQIVVLSHRSVAGLSPEEISRAITLVATIADDNDEPLQEEFGAA